MPAEPTSLAPGLNNKDRQIRVFISSTFRDMQAERDILIKKIFPQLRKLCEERAVTWTEVDLRWGITDEEVAEGKVLPLCLEEIQRCRPYFIGLLGERYGSLPREIPPELVERQKWLEQHRDKSITELEIIHGVLRDEEMHGHAYFYFRDPKYLGQVPNEKQSDFTAENAESAEKLEWLKKEIRWARDEQVCRLREDFHGPEQLGEWILEDFKVLIEKLYPKEQVPAALDQEAERHEAYAQSRRLAFVGREDLLGQLDEHVSAGVRESAVRSSAFRRSHTPEPPKGGTPNQVPAGKPLVLTGDSGCGKSALLAEWVARWRKHHPNDLIIQHYIGSTPDSADWQGLVRRILGELKRAFAITDDIPLQPDDLRGALNDWTVRAAGPSPVWSSAFRRSRTPEPPEGGTPNPSPQSHQSAENEVHGDSQSDGTRSGGRRIILVLDALNQLAEDGAAWQLGWLPVVFPANFRVLVSSLPGESHDALRKRGWPELNVPLFARADIAPAALAYFKVLAKTPPKDIVARLESTPAACNALYLRAVLDELRQFGKHEELEARAADYLSAPNLPELFDHILTRWHDDFGKDPEHPDLVRRSLCLIACARFGLSESELLDLLGKKNAQGEDEPMPRRPWTPFYLAAENAVILRAGVLNFGHEYLSTAVRKRWLGESKTMLQFRLELVEYFTKVVDPTDRKLDELPMLLRDLEQWERLKDLLIDLHTFLRLRSSELWRWDLHRCWFALRPHYNAGDVYRRGCTSTEAFDPEAHGLPFPLSELASFLHETGDYKSAELFDRWGLAILTASRGPNNPDVAVQLNNLAQTLQKTGRFEEAELLFRRALAIDEQTYGLRHDTVARDLNNLADLLKENARHEDAERLMRRSLEINEQTHGPFHVTVGTRLTNLGSLLFTTGRLTEAEPIMRRALTIYENVLGSNHPNVATSLNNLAMLLKHTNRLPEAEPLMRRALAIDEQYFGIDHLSVARDLNNLAQLLLETNRLAEAEPMLRHALAILERDCGPENPDVASAIGNLGCLLQKANRLEEAEPLLRRALSLDETRKGASHPRLARDLNNLATLLSATNRAAEAEPLYCRAIAIDEKIYVDKHPVVAVRLNNLAQMHKDAGRLKEAEPLMRRALLILLQFTFQEGYHHPDLQTVGQNYKSLLEAMSLSQSQIRVQLNELGHPFGMKFPG